MLVAALALSTFVCAVETLAPDDTQAIVLGPHLELLVLPRGSAVDDARALRDDPEAAFAAPGYVRVDRQVPTWGFGSAVIWARFSTLPVGKRDERWLLRAGFPRPDRIQLFQRDAGTGRFVERSRAGLVDVHGLFAQDVTLPIDVNAAGPHLVRVETQPARVNLQLVEERTLADIRAREMLVAGVYYGIFAGLFLYNLFLGFSLRDPTHALYCAFLVCMALHVAARDGLGFAEAPSAIAVGGAGLSVTSLIMLVFARRFLRLQEPARAVRFRRVNQLIAVELALCALLVVASFVGAQLAAASAALTGVAITTVVVAAALVARDGDGPARWFLLAWSVLIASSIWSVVHAFGASDANLFVRHGMKFGSAMEMVLLSLALASRVRALRAEKERAELALASARTAAQAELAGRVIAAQEAERARYARELHDGLGHTLLAIKERVARGVRHGRGLDVGEAQHVAGETQQALDDARAMARNLVPPSLSRLGLMEALRGVCADTTAAGSMRVTLEGQADEDVPDVFGDEAIHFVRVAQEALANALRHGHAKNATVSLNVDAAMSRVVLTITDDGSGFDPEAVRRRAGAGGGDGGAGGGGLGTLDMEQRAKLLGGTLRVTSSVGAGTRVEVRVPYAKKQGVYAIVTDIPSSASSSVPPLREVS